jgi:hypothetical protein
MRKEIRGRSIPERIKVYFEDRITEAHVDAVCSYAEITEEQFRMNIGAAKDLLPALTPIYREAGVKMPGWWTSRPTNHIHAWSVRMMLEQRWIPEGERAVKGHHDRAYVMRVEVVLAAARMILTSYLATAVDDLGVHPENDYVIVDVNEAIDRGDLAVHRP